LETGADPEGIQSLKTISAFGLPMLAWWIPPGRPLHAHFAFLSQGSIRTIKDRIIKSEALFQASLKNAFIFLYFSNKVQLQPAPGKRSGFPLVLNQFYIEPLILKLII